MSTALTTPTAAPQVAVSAVEMGARQREISVSEFFTKNRHLLGFDNPRKALLTCVKEAVDNALDAAEEAGILPDVAVTLEVAPSNGDAPHPASQATRFRVTVTDNDGESNVPAEAELTIRSPFTDLNLARNPSFEVDTRFWNSYAGSILERVQGEAHEGSFGLRITGPPVINGSFGVNDSPDQVRWTLGPGLRYRYTAWVRSPSSHGQAKLRVTESAADFDAP